MTSVSSIKMVAMAKAMSVSPRSLAYTYRATVNVAEEDSQRSHKVIEHQAEAGGVQQRRALAHNAAHRQDAAGDDAVHRVGQHHSADHVPFTGAHGQGALPVGVRDGLQALLGGADDGGQDHHHQGQAAGQHARSSIPSSG